MGGDSADPELTDPELTDLEMAEVADAPAPHIEPPGLETCRSFGTRDGQARPLILPSAAPSHKASPKCKRGDETGNDAGSGNEIRGHLGGRSGAHQECRRKDQARGRARL
ncbi:hypothetical protein NHU_01814 [Rhodovulum sulfidophilum]|uniref:Uncharacterized protein n=1 Tax=Rhodovulum sulfidophilum TaxID=35806 RepID=A0A0D6B2Q3_RHOSU|nr:hypothetical protein NHU_01814 [Rhodovulum sulfidophilum]